MPVLPRIRHSSDDRRRWSAHAGYAAMDGQRLRRIQAGREPGLGPHLMPVASNRKKAPAAGPSLAFNHAMVYTGKFAEARRFYVELLGFKVLEEMAPYYARLR